jgi:Acetyltransferase (GNAT) domain
VSGVLRLQCFDSYAQLPGRYDSLLGKAGEKGFFHSHSWFEFLMQSEWEGSLLRLYGVEDDGGQPLLLAPLRLTELDGAVPYARTLASIGHTENYSVLSLVFDPVLDKAQCHTVLTALFDFFRSSQPAVDVLRLWPVETGSALAKELGQALREGGFWVQAYNNSFNRYEHTAGVDWEGYLAGRSANQRYNIRRRKRNLENSGDLELDIYTGEHSAEELRSGMDDYIIATVECWKGPNSLVSKPMLDLIRLAASENCLRLGVLKYNDRPIAGQFWIVAGGVAHCMRLAYHEDYKKQAPGVVLTAHMLAHLLDEDRVATIDFGIGDEEAKEKWMRNSRDYAGFMAFNPRTPLGVIFAAKHIVGQRLKSILKSIVKALMPANAGRRSD